VGRRATRRRSYAAIEFLLCEHDLSANQRFTAKPKHRLVVKVAKQTDLESHAYLGFWTMISGLTCKTLPQARRHLTNIRQRYLYDDQNPRPLGSDALNANV
jgi:hypothetical protein